MGLSYYLTKLFAQSLSTFAASVMAIVSGAILRRNSTVASHILFFLAIADFLFSLTGAISTSIKVSGRRELLETDWHKILVADIHWSLEISSFIWTAALAFYIMHQNRKDFSINLSHAVIWLTTVAYFILELYALFQKSPLLLIIVRLIWDAIALVTLFTVVLALSVISNRGHAKRNNVNGIVKVRLQLYMVAFIVLVSPNLVDDVMYFLNCSNYKFDQVSSTAFALLPFANGCIYTLNARYFSCFVKEDIYHETEDTEALELPSKPIINELKGLEIGEKIGQGVAVVYKGKWRGADVAVKMQMLALSEEDVAGFEDECNEEIQQEANLMKRLTHPNIVLFMEAGFYNGSICIISEFCTKGSLRNILEKSQKEQLVWPMKIRLAIGIANGLQYLHNSTSKMIHRDLKSPNIVVDETWHSKIADFGTLRFSEIIYSKDQRLKKTQESQNLMTGLVGTTRWMAPEVIKDEKNYDEKIDIYSFGVILWELIEGKLPFDEIRWNHTIEKVIVQGKRPLIPPESCPPRWKVLVSMCWQADPYQRPNIRQVIRSLQRIAREEIWERMYGRGSAKLLETNLQKLDCDYILHNTKCDVDKKRFTTVSEMSEFSDMTSSQSSFIETDSMSSSISSYSSNSSFFKF